MAARRLVLNGLTAEVAGGAGGGGSAPASPEFYHELELYRVLLALPEPRARTPDPPVRARRVHRRARTPDARAPPPPLPPPQTRPARYLGSFGAGGAPDARADVSRRLHCMKEGAGGCAVPVLLAISLAGVKVCDPHDQSVRMSHALRRISYATCERARALFAFVAREPRAEPRTEPRTEPLEEPGPEPSAEPNAEPNQQYCHAFETDTPEQAEELNALVGDAFRMAFASQLQPSAPLWSRELNGGGGAGGGGSCSRIPDSLPGLTAHYPHLIDRSPTRCDNLGGRRGDEGEASEASPSSSEEWNSPTELSCYRRLGERGVERGERGAERGERPGVMRRLALGLSGALLQPSDDDSTPLVTDTPTTPTNAPLCLGAGGGGGGGGGGYINEASEEARRDRERRRRAAEHDFDFTHLVNGRGAGSSAAASTSSGSSCASGNNNTAPNAGAQRPPEPELTHAPWFQQGIPREIALEVLAAQAPGAFLVRASTTQAGCLALSLRVPRDFAPHGLAHYLILRTPKGYKIKGFTKEFRSLSALVTHHSVMPELLPVPLRLPRAPPRPRPDMEALERLAPPPAAAATPAPPPAPPRLAYRAPLDV